ncbi:unnamed protein product [Ectocarpus sp. 4 AP-2014]
MAAGVLGKKDAKDKNNELRVVVPGRAGEEGEGTTLAAAGAGRGGRVCSVCARASADYSCPRCLVGYCSSKCYKVHGAGCTEAFFRGHVERETRLREGDEVERSSGVKGPKAGRRASMVEVLRRIRLTDRGGDGDGGDGPHAEEGEVGEDEDGELMFQPERLEALASSSSSSSSSGSEFPASRSGTAAAAAAATGEEQEEDGSSSSSCTRHSFAALLSQAFQAPGFSTINAREPSPTLPALATDLAYAYVLTSRLYNGCWCSDPVGASLALVGASPVLKDGATPATAGEALAACVERAVEGERSGFRGYAESLRQDVLQVCSDPRKLICAFQDAWVMLEAAGRTLAPSMAKSFLPAAGRKAQRKAARELGKVEKRIGYFLLWARTHGEEVSPQMMRDVEAAVAPAAEQQRGIRMAA